MRCQLDLSKLPLSGNTVRVFKFFFFSLLSVWVEASYIIAFFASQLLRRFGLLVWGSLASACLGSFVESAMGALPRRLCYLAAWRSDGGEGENFAADHDVIPQPTLVTERAG